MQVEKGRTYVGVNLRAQIFELLAVLFESRLRFEDIAVRISSREYGDGERAANIKYTVRCKIIRCTRHAVVAIEGE